ncbi:MAG: DUF3500 domain-containing protein [Bryobacteraceae bacterium]|nr:DUF3500 domain-containing protein [Bryobacteraceae bacterium]
MTLSLLAATAQDPAPVLTTVANNFLASLSTEQSAKARFAFADEERFNWHFIPKERKGLPIREMAPFQRHLASALLNAALSQKGYIKATTVMSLEDVLKILEKDNGERRNAEKYYFSIFGEPADKGIWGLRVEGHHLSLNFTIADGKIKGSPNFLGANPAEVREGPRKGLRPLHAEEDLARELLASLTAEQKSAAIVSKTAYKDILTEASRKVALTGQPNGLSAAKLNTRQREQLQKVIQEYITNLPEPVAQARQALVKKSGNNINFAWAGVEERGGPHYYRIQSPDFLIEYDNTQNDANHIHSVWREISGDWGGDLLGDHYKTSQHN